MSNLSFVRHKGDGVTNQFALSVAGENIGYFRISDIHGYVDDKEVPITIDPNSPHIVRFVETPKLNADILIRRQMPVKKTYADFERGNNFGHRQVNNTFVQQLYLTQELLDGFFPGGFYFKQDVDLGGHRIINLGDAVNPSDAINKKVADELSKVDESLSKRISSLENSVSGNSRFLPWSYNAVGGEDILNPPYNFDSARVFINGVRQRAGAMGSYCLDNKVIRLAEPLEEGDWVDVELGTEPDDYTDTEISLKRIEFDVNNLNTKREAIEWRTGLEVRDPLQLYIYKGIKYLPKKEEVPFTTSASFESDKWVLSDVMTRRKGCVMFMFDDWYESHYKLVFPLFKRKGLKCAFANNAWFTLHKTKRSVNVSELIEMQDAGFEIVNHTYTGIPLNNPNVPYVVAESEMNDGLHSLLDKGLNVIGYMAGNSYLDPKYHPIMQKHHSWAFTMYNDHADERALIDFNKPYYMQRISLQSVTLDEAKSLIDLAYNSGKGVCFYDHDPAQVDYPNSKPISFLSDVLDYCISKEVDVLTPSKAVARYGDLVHKQSGLFYANNLIDDSVFSKFTKSFGNWSLNNLAVDDRVVYEAGNSSVLKATTGELANNASSILSYEGVDIIYDDGAKCRDLTFSIGVTSGSNPVPNVSLGLQFTNAEGVSIYSKETDSFKCDNFGGRRYSISVSKKDLPTAGKGFVKVFVRVTNKTGAINQFALSFDSPMLNTGLMKSARSLSDRNTSTIINSISGTMEQGSITQVILSNYRDIDKVAIANNEIVSRYNQELSLTFDMYCDLGGSFSERGFVRTIVTKTDESGKSQVFKSTSPVINGYVIVSNSVTIDVKTGDKVKYEIFNSLSTNVIIQSNQSQLTITAT